MQRATLPIRPCVIRRCRSVIACKSVRVTMPIEAHSFRSRFAGSLRSVRISEIAEVHRHVPSSSGVTGAKRGVLDLGCRSVVTRNHGPPAMAGRCFVRAKTPGNALHSSPTGGPHAPRSGTFPASPSHHRLPIATARPRRHCAFPGRVHQAFGIRWGERSSP